MICGNSNDQTKNLLKVFKISVKHRLLHIQEIIIIK